ncbi:hypothetical protein ACFFIF_10100 [Vagococcus entomophilus]|uniref:Uncharacterized protein n=1 Tax=Vagococcus entomophilus TaxID=1160095 RepID=A0A430AG94_9ENTE|nr:hypothetical protein [Vagococcus entomophilus]RSU06903.1 hypothetical protein CBF30_06485 [Vagococcus entomophilus]
MDPVQEQMNSIENKSVAMGRSGISLLWKNKTTLAKFMLQPVQFLYKSGANLIKGLITKNSKGKEMEQKKPNLSKASSVEKSVAGKKAMGIAVGEPQKAQGAKKTMGQIKGKVNESLDQLANTQPELKVAKKTLDTAVDIAKTVASKVNNTQQKDKKQAPSKGIGI